MLILKITNSDIQIDGGRPSMHAVRIVMECIGLKVAWCNSRGSSAEKKSEGRLEAKEKLQNGNCILYHEI